MLKLTLHCQPEGTVVEIFAEGKALRVHSFYGLASKTSVDLLRAIGKVCDKIKPFSGPQVSLWRAKKPKRKKRKP
jgi:hypothetical protein